MNQDGSNPTAFLKPDKNAGESSLISHCGSQLVAPVNVFLFNCSKNRSQMAVLSLRLVIIWKRERFRKRQIRKVGV